MILRQDRESVIEESKLRAVGLQRIFVKDRLGGRPEQRQVENPPAKYVKNADGSKAAETRSCNICRVKGHLAYNCPEKNKQKGPADKNMGGGDNAPKRQATDVIDGADPKKPAPDTTKNGDVIIARESTKVGGDNHELSAQEILI